MSMHNPERAERLRLVVAMLLGRDISKATAYSNEWHITWLELAQVDDTTRWTRNAESYLRSSTLAQALVRAGMVHRNSISLYVPEELRCG
jgi:hypothetical protein